MRPKIIGLPAGPGAHGRIPQETASWPRRGRRCSPAAPVAGRRVPDPTSFRLDRPDYSYMHFGAGMHECFGLYMNREMVPAICKAVLKRSGLRRAPGDAGRLRMESIFPMSLVVEFDA